MQSSRPLETEILRSWSWSWSIGLDCFRDRSVINVHWQCNADLWMLELRYSCQQLVTTSLIHCGSLQRWWKFNTCSIVSNAYLFYVSFAGIGLGLVAAGLDYNTGSSIRTVLLNVHRSRTSTVAWQSLIYWRQRITQPTSWPHVASRTWSSTEQMARFHTSDWRPLETCCRPWTWWCNDATALDDDDDDDDEYTDAIPPARMHGILASGRRRRRRRSSPH